MRTWRAYACAAVVAAATAQAAVAAERLLEKRESLYNNIYIYSDGDTVTMSFGRNKRFYSQSGLKLSDPGALLYEYSRAMTVGLAYAPKLDRILEIGLGGGINSSYLHAALPKADILTVELDKEVVDLAKKYFKYQETDGKHVTLADGRAFLMRDAGGWDMIVVDAYRRGFVPFHLVTKEFYTLVKSRLAPGGVVVQNIEPSTLLFDSATATLKSVFASVDFYDGYENVIAVAYDGPSLPQSELVARASKVQQELKLRYDLRPMLAERRVLRRPAGKVLTDDFAPVETLRAIEQNNQNWKAQTEAPR
jgi:spermidine synthase